MKLRGAARRGRRLVAGAGTLELLVAAGLMGVVTGSATAVGLYCCGGAAAVNAYDAATGGPRFPALGAANLPGNAAVLATHASPPVEVTIPALGIHSLLVGLHVGTDGTLAVPTNTAAVGWDVDGPAPGEPGVAVLVGHLDSATGPAVFYRLGHLVRGDVVRVRRAGGDTLEFRVDRVGAYPRGHIPASAFSSSAPALGLITCTGAFDRDAGRYRENLVVVATKSAP